MKIVGFFCLFLSFFPSIAQNIDREAQILKQREALVQIDSLQYFDQELVLDKDELQLDRLMSAYRDKVLKMYKDQHFFPPARNFYLSKSHIEKDSLFQLLRRMPKGGILHLHMSAMGDAEWLIEEGFKYPEVHIYWGEEKPGFTKGQMQAFARNEAPKGFINTRKIIRAIPSIKDSLLDLFTFDQAIDRDSVDIWGEFEKVFQRITPLINYRPIFEAFIDHSLAILIEDNIQHAELRILFYNRIYDLTIKAGDFPIDTMVQIMDRNLLKAKRLDPNFTLKLIYTNLRFREAKEIRKDVIRAVEMKKRFPTWVKGYDLVAEEDNGYPSIAHLKEFLLLDSLESENQIDLPIYLHDGESNWPDVDNLYTAIALGTKRIGHGYNLFRFPALIDEVKRREICLEVNPLSNQILGYIRDLRNHPASTYLRRGINITINSDDPLIFNYHGLSYDFWSVYMAWKLDLRALKKLSKNSIEYSALSEEEKTLAMEAWQLKWDNFIQQALVNWK